jgi:hypothetical protein
MAIYHVLLIEFKPTTHHATVEEVRTIVQSWLLMYAERQSDLQKVAGVGRRLHASYNKETVHEVIRGW